jgi:hypothetical protein
VSWSSQWALSFWLSHQYIVCILLLPIRATYPAYLILLDSIILFLDEWSKRKKMPKPSRKILVECKPLVTIILRAFSFGWSI